MWAEEGFTHLEPVQDNENDIDIGTIMDADEDKEEFAPLVSSNSKEWLENLKQPNMLCTRYKLGPKQVFPKNPYMSLDRSRHQVKRCKTGIPKKVPNNV